MKEIIEEIFRGASEETEDMVERLRVATSAMRAEGHSKAQINMCVLSVLHDLKDEDPRWIGRITAIAAILLTKEAMK